MRRGTERTSGRPSGRPFACRDAARTADRAHQAGVSGCPVAAGSCRPRRDRTGAVRADAVLAHGGQSGAGTDDHRPAAVVDRLPAAMAGDQVPALDPKVDPIKTGFRLPLSVGASRPSAPGGTVPWSAQGPPRASTPCPPCGYHVVPRLLRSHAPGRPAWSGKGPCLGPSGSAYRLGAGARRHRRRVAARSMERTEAAPEGVS